MTPSSWRARVLLLGALTSLVLASSGAAQTRSWPSEAPPRPLAARPVNFPPYEIRTLPNGLKVVLVSHHEQPAVSVRMIVRAGAAMDPKGKLGLAMLTASLLDQGAGNRTAEQIADAIDFAGGILGTGAGTDLTYVNTVVMKDSLTLGLQLMADVIRRPSFAPDEIERQRQQAMSALKVAAEDPDNVASQVIDRLIYGFHPYGLPGSGTAESLASLKRQDFVDFHQQFYVPNNALLAIVGDIGPDEALAGVKQAFGDWAPRDVAPFKPIDPPPPTKRVVIIDKPDAVQTEIRVGQIGIPRKHDDFVALDQAVKILGGEGANRLQQVLRSQRSLTYGASADLDTYKTAGGIVAETDTRSTATAETLRVIVDEILRLQRERVYDGELSGAQAYMVGHFPLTVETPDAIATQVLNQLFYDLPLEELQTYRDRVLRIGPDDIQRVARSYFKPDRLAVVLVGNASAFINDLKGIGFGDYERIPIEQVDLLAADLKKSGRIAPAQFPASARGTLPARASAGSRHSGSGFFGRDGGPAFQGASVFSYQDRAAAEPRPTEKEQVDQLIRKAIDARGGLEALKGVKRLVAEATTTLTTPGGKLSAKTTTYVEFPERLRVEADLPDAQIVQVYADGQAWQQDPGGLHDAPPEMLAEFRASARRDLVALLVGAGSGQLETRLLPEEGHQGRVLKVLGISVADTAEVRLHIDPLTGAVVKIAYDSRTPASARVDESGRASATQAAGSRTTEEVFDDYRTVDSISLPFKASIVRGGKVVLERVLTSVKINPTIAPEMFAKPR